jgi:hypothetical protein
LNLLQLSSHEITGSLSTTMTQNAVRANLQITSASKNEALSS